MRTLSLFVLFLAFRLSASAQTTQLEPYLGGGYTFRNTQKTSDTQTYEMTDWNGNPNRHTRTYKATDEQDY